MTDWAKMTEPTFNTGDRVEVHSVSKDLYVKAKDLNKELVGKQGSVVHIFQGYSGQYTYTVKLDKVRPLFCFRYGEILPAKEG